EAARRAGAPGVARGEGPIHARVAHEDLRELAREHPRLVHLAPALVGAPDPRLVLPDGGVRRDDRRTRGPDFLPEVRRYGAGAGPRRPGHVVLVVAVAVL